LEREELIEKYFPYEKFKIGQKETIDKILDSFNTNNIFILEAPTGTGKSAIAYTVGNVLNREIIYNNKSPVAGPRVLILTGNKNLQMQYQREFKIPSLWSSQEYDCLKYPDNKDIHFADPLCFTNSCEKYMNCPYINARNEFMSSLVGVTNYHFYFTLKSLTPSILICDEAHLIEGILDDMDSLSLKEHSLKNLLDRIKRIFFSPTKVADFSSGVDKLLIFIKDKNPEILDDYLIDYIVKNFEPCVSKMYNILVEELSQYNQSFNLQDILSKPPDDFIVNTGEILADDHVGRKVGEISKITKKLELLKSKIESVKSFNKKEANKSIVSVDNRKGITITVKPLVQDTSYRLSKIYRSTKNILFMSGTICGEEYFAKSLGIDQEFGFISTDSNIPKENRPFYYVPKYSFSYSNKEKAIKSAVIYIDSIVNKAVRNGFLNKLGIIHSVSYDNADYILKHSKFKHLMFIPNKYELRDIQNVMKKRRLIVISPTMTEGIDLPYDLSRWQIFVKVPYASLQDRWTKIKAKLEPDWYIRKTILTIVQGAGRSIRFEDDKASTFIFDSQFGRLKRNLFPEWFRVAIKDILE
jgi:ATP-dependent DNA helicase DinG